jgi:CheY-specific phosphatase CheX
MSVTEQIENHLAEQVRLAVEVFATMVGIDVEPAPMVWPPQGKLVSAGVHFAGGCEGAMIVECTLPLAFTFTSRLMSIPMPHAVDRDVRDAIGELANTIGGNFKALIPAVCDLSVPTVGTGRYPYTKDPNTVKLTEITFQSPAGDFCLILAVPQQQSHAACGYPGQP